MTAPDLPLADCLTPGGAAAVRSILIATPSPASGSGEFGVLATDILADLGALGVATGTRAIPRRRPRRAADPQLQLFDPDTETAA